MGSTPSPDRSDYYLRPAPTRDVATPYSKFPKVATGGTFDQLHAGHRRLLEKAFEVGDEVVIGLTSDEFANKEGKSPKHPYATRRADLEAFLGMRFPGRRFSIAKLDDYFGPGIASKDVVALVASPETGKRVDLANKMRAQRGFPPLQLAIVDWVVAEDGRPISSTRIKKGEIDMEGRLIERKRPGGRSR
jgi:cytidyltransferase-like protein